MLWILVIAAVLAAAALWAWANRSRLQAGAGERAHRSAKGDAQIWRAPHQGGPGGPG